MPTHNRRSFVPQAIRCFLRQDYSNLELLVVDDGTESIADLVSVSDRVRYVRFDQKLTIGAKRNLANEKARGEFIVHWDDDDWYPRGVCVRRCGRCSIVARICVGVVVSRTSIRREIKRGSIAIHQRRDRGSPATRSLIARVSGAVTSFPTFRLAKTRALFGPVKDVRSWISPIRDCVATVHSNNTSRKNVNAVYWHAQPRDYIDSLIGDDIYFYRAVETSWPLVSCIMPTYERRRYIPQALQSFLQQDYPNRELIIVDDGKDAIGDLVESCRTFDISTSRARRSVRSATLRANMRRARSSRTGMMTTGIHRIDCVTR